MKTLKHAFALAPALGVLLLQTPDIQLRPVQVPNDISYWKNDGFQEMIPPMRLPTDKSIENFIQVWIKIPDDCKITVDRLEGQNRFTLKFPRIWMTKGGTPITTPFKSVPSNEGGKSESLRRPASGFDARAASFF